jgi:hypothetical protein
MNPGMEAEPNVPDWFYAALAVFWLVTYIYFAIFAGMILKKAGQPAWAAWVPVYNQWKLNELGGIRGAWSLLVLGAFVPFIGSLLSIGGAVLFAIASYRMAPAYGRDPVVSVLLYIFLPVVWLPYMAVSKAYDETRVPAPLV